MCCKVVYPYCIETTLNFRHNIEWMSFKFGMHAHARTQLDEVVFLQFDLSASVSNGFDEVICVQ